MKLFTKFGKTFNRIGLKAAKHSPEILVGVGIVGFVGTVVLASKETLYLEEIVQEHEKTMENINEAVQDEKRPDYTEDEASHDKFVQTVRTVKRVGRLYAPAFALGLFSAACIIGAHHILLRRQAALSAAYVGMKSAYDSYRERVKEELGEAKEQELYLGIRDKVEQLEKNGKVKEVVTKTLDTPNPYSPYARVFQEGNKWWVRDRAANVRTLRMIQAHANDVLQLHGHIFLNEVYDMLGLDRTPEGQMVGWVLGNGDDCVDFGVFDQADGEGGFLKPLWDWEQERRVTLDFNVDGEVWQLI